ncbi:MAG: prepilin-type N-terminal cleavage/methylation domain-containing protein [Oscillospiraceae bacterium]
MLKSLKKINKKIDIKKNTKGFTLIELVVVVAIVAVLAAVGIPAVAGQVKKSNEASAAANAKLIAETATTIIAESEMSGISESQMNDALRPEKIMKRAGISEGKCTGITKTLVRFDTYITYEIAYVRYQAKNGKTIGEFSRS